MVKEAEVFGVCDHLACELPSLMRYAQSRKLTFPDSALRFVDLDVAQTLSSATRSRVEWINAALDVLERY